jgi:hypothetical protein
MREEILATPNEPALRAADETVLSTSGLGQQLPSSTVRRKEDFGPYRKWRVVSENVCSTSDNYRQLEGEF